MTVEKTIVKVHETEYVVIVYDRIEEKRTVRHLRKAAEEGSREIRRRFLPGLTA